MITQNEINILNKIPAKDFIDIYNQNKTTLNINDGRILGYEKDTEEDHLEER